MKNLITDTYRHVNSNYDLGNWLEMLRNRASLTQTELGRLVGMSDTTIRKWENGSSSPKAANLKRLIEVYVQRGIFTPQKEGEEAAALWSNANLNAAFDEAWFMALLKEKETPAFSAEPVVSEPQVKPGERSRPWHNLPQRSYQRFVGRQLELDKLIKQLMLPYPRSRHFLVTLDGIGGVGKSALALELAYYYRDNYAILPPTERFEALIWVSAKRTLLTARGNQQRPQTFSNLSDLYREIATVLELRSILQVRPEQQRGLIERALTGQRTLLIVDNLETVDDEELLTFLRELPDPTKGIVTTRHRIDIAYPIRLTGMPYADALALIRLEATHKNVELPSESVIVEELFRRTGGIPLAIVWSIGLLSLGYEVESVLRRLGSGHSNIARFCFEESVGHIRERDAYRLLLALSMFEASVNRTMLGEVAGLGWDEIGRDDGLAELLQLSLVNKDGERFTLLPLTRNYALEELANLPKLGQELRENWVTYFTTISRSYGGLDWRWRDHNWLQQEGQHLTTLAAWSQQETRLDILLQIFPALAYYYHLIGQWKELLTTGQIVLEYSRLTGNLESIVFTEQWLSWLLRNQGRYDEATNHAIRAHETAKQMDHTGWLCTSLVTYSQVQRFRGEFDQAIEYCQQALQLVEGLTGEQQIYVRTDIEYELGKIARDRGDWKAAQDHFLIARETFNHEEENILFNTERAWGLLSNLGFVAYQLGDLDTAAQNYQQCFESYQGAGSKGDKTTLLVRMAALEEQRGAYEVAWNYANEALIWSQKLEMVLELAQAKAICERLSRKLLN